MYVALVGGRVWALVPAVAAAAVLGAFLPRVGVTAPLAVLLVGLTGPVEAFGVPGLPQLAGCLWAGVPALPPWGRARGTVGPRAVTGGDPRAVGHAVRAGTLAAVSSSAMAVLGHLTGEGHWLVTGALLALTPSPEATRTRVRQRVVGNTLGGVTAAVALVFHPGPWAITVVVAVCSGLAYALRPANYLYWCLLLPPLLLLLSDFDDPLPWYAAAVRAGLVLLGGVMAAVFARWRWPDTLGRPRG
ncbi:FUSC family protein [Streptomyces sp. ME03-5709C]|nr:FUSC family protein [Streptomyces sp. ME03-5709C]